MPKKLVGVLVVILLVVLAATLGPTAAFHLLSPARTGEAGRLADVLGVQPGAVVADIGAGDGEMAVEIARAVGSEGLVYATELTDAQREEIAEAARGAGLSQVRVVAARDRATGLPDGCCDAVYLRTVLHHIVDPDAYAKELRKTLRSGGRLAIIDFRPGRFLHLGGSHGITADQTIQAMSNAGFRLERRIDDWGGRLYLLLFRAG
jgi:ubiquinone/menaquinone biosynthesis C-methylase UbiE